MRGRCAHARRPWAPRCRAPSACFVSDDGRPSLGVAGSRDGRTVDVAVERQRGRQRHVVGGEVPASTRARTSPVRTGPVDAITRARDPRDAVGRSAWASVRHLRPARLRVAVAHDPEVPVETPSVGWRCPEDPCGDRGVGRGGPAAPSRAAASRWRRAAAATQSPVSVQDRALVADHDRRPGRSPTTVSMRWIQLGRSRRRDRGRAWARGGGGRRGHAARAAAAISRRRWGRSGGTMVWARVDATEAGGLALARAPRPRPASARARAAGP